MRIAVAVACARPDAPLAATLDAILAQTGAVTVTLALEAHALEATARERGADVVLVPAPGIAAARNAALAACVQPVLALLDEDTAPLPGWHAALENRWRSASTNLAMAGGPIAANVVGRRPSWLSEDLLSVFGAVDHGSPSRTIDGTTTRLLGGNLSMRVDVVRALGGFWPMRGHPEVRGWYDAEALLQRDTAKAGWEIAWLAEAAVSRRIEAAGLTRRRLLHRRRRHGALLGAVGNERSRGQAARQVATSTLGVPVAMLTASGQRTMQRLSRTVENLAVLGGARAAAAMLAPTGTTAFRPAVPLAPPQRPRRAGTGALVLLYHRVDRDEHDPLGLCVSPRHFAEHAEVLASRNVVPVEELAAAVRRGRVPRGAIAVTFDDGYRDNLVNAAPVLDRAGIPATVFVATGHVATGTSFAADVVAQALLGPGPRPDRLMLTMGAFLMSWRTDGPHGRRLAHDQVQAWLRTLDGPAVDALVRYLRTWAGERAVAEARVMSVPELRTLAAYPGISIGAHSQHHLSLARQDEPTRHAELRGSRDDVHAWVGVRPVGFAYPYGVPGEDVDGPTTSSASAAGFDHGVVNHPGVVGVGSDPMALPRLAVPDVDGAEFERLIHGLVGHPA